MPDPLHVAIVGSGPSACYAAAELLVRHPAVTITVFEQLLMPYGLVRTGVAPDHQQKKRVTERFAATLADPRVRLRLGVRIGRDLSHAELLKHCHAVIYAVGASDGKKLGIPGEDLPGSHCAASFVAWYNGHPGHRDRSSFDLSGERAVVIGNGNVALDVARILLSGTDVLERTDIAEPALAELRQSRIREVVILGRRGPAQASYSSAEFIELLAMPSAAVCVDDVFLDSDEQTRTLAFASADPQSRMKADLARTAATVSASAPVSRRIVFRFLAAPLEITGADRATGVRFARTSLRPGPDGDVEARLTSSSGVVPATLVLFAAGHRSPPVPALPYRKSTGTVPHQSGRVFDLAAERTLTGTYVTGWIKRGPSGVIGTNKFCAAETVTAVLDDFAQGRLPDPICAPGALDLLVDERCEGNLDFAGWSRVDLAERNAGARHGKVRVKFTAPEALLAGQPGAKRTT